MALVWRRHRIAGVSAVAGHRQQVLASLVSQRERRVFSPVPQTVVMLDLPTVTRIAVRLLQYAQTGPHC